ncbi:GntR family transcriptional regulator [Streptomyces sp. M19]
MALGMSKTPIREALKTLVGSGLVVLSAYRGASVRAMDSTAAAAVYDMRLLLEPEGVRRSVRNGGDLDLARRSLDLAAAAGAADDTAEMSLHNREFHRALYMACGNPILVRTLDELRDQAALVTVSGWRSAGGSCDEADEHEGSWPPPSRATPTGPHSFSPPTSPVSSTGSCPRSTGGSTGGPAADRSR